MNFIDDSVRFYQERIPKIQDAFARVAAAKSQLAVVRSASTRKWDANATIPGLTLAGF